VKKSRHSALLMMKDLESGHAIEDGVSDDSARKTATSHTLFLSTTSLDLIPRGGGSSEVDAVRKPQLPMKKRNRYFLTPPRKQLLREMLAEMVGVGMIVFFGTGAVMSAIAREALGKYSRVVGVDHVFLYQFSL
jgi:hypothetical protein